jgi:flagellar protein FlaI
VLLQAQVRVGTKMTRRVRALTEIVGIDPETNELITNAAYSWNPADDKFNFSGHSYVYSKYAESKNWTMREMDREVKRRVILLKYMDMMNFRRHVQVAGLISQYYRNPQEVMKTILEEMKAKGIDESI